ncbi:42284_t:CDS:2 [Gigaspora margarita]|uniref:42284_t:CDS:1 n=1 Tax=Gigaspora margarita TaxID=4874 RepID=A0ABM8W696_GIGMA|nr:42284_t:CDS:2 [Gigaspora margarita]
MELDDDEAINEWIDNDVLSKKSNDMTSEEFNDEASSKESISDKALSEDKSLIKELDYKNSSKISDNSEIISEESNECIKNEEEPDKIVNKSLSREQCHLLVKKNVIIIVTQDKIIKYITINILYNKNNINESSSIVIHKILYKYQEHKKLRNIAYSYQYSSEFVALKDLLISIPVYKLYTDLYYDNFGTFCNIYYLLGSIYIQIRNLLFDKRRQLRNHFMLGSKSLVIASLGDVTADLPQGNDLVGIKRHGATIGYHMVPTITRCKEIATEYGLHIKLPILDKLKREKHLQLLHDIYHITAGKVLRFFKITINTLSLEKKQLL